MQQHDLDVVGTWTEVKLAILKEYAAAYAKILAKQEKIRHFAYIDGFAGFGELISKATGQKVAGSPSVALSITPPFSHYHFIDMDGKRADALRKLAGDRKHVTVYTGDCNEVLVNKVFPTCSYKDYRRALCLLDPYQLNPRWEVVETAGKMRSIELLLNFMIMDANMNVLRKKPELVSTKQAERMDAFWGDSSWREAGYRKDIGLFEEIEEKESNERIVAAYRNRLQEVAGFKYVAEPMPIKNSKGAIIYYLLFASPKATGARIANDIFSKYRKPGGEYGS